MTDRSEFDANNWLSDNIATTTYRMGKLSDVAVRRRRWKNTKEVLKLLWIMVLCTFWFFIQCYR